MRLLLFKVKYIGKFNKSAFAELGSPQKQSNTIIIDSLKQIHKSNTNGFPKYRQYGWKSESRCEAGSSCCLFDILMFWCVSQIMQYYVTINFRQIRYHRNHSNHYQSDFYDGRTNGFITVINYNQNDAVVHIFIHYSGIRIAFAKPQQT